MKRKPSKNPRKTELKLWNGRIEAGSHVYIVDWNEKLAMQQLQLKFGTEMNHAVFCKRFTRTSFNIAIFSDIKKKPGIWEVSKDNPAIRLVV